MSLDDLLVQMSGSYRLLIFDSDSDSILELLSMVIKFTRHGHCARGGGVLEGGGGYGSGVF